MDEAVAVIFHKPGESGLLVVWGIDVATDYCSIWSDQSNLWIYRSTTVRQWIFRRWSETVVDDGRILYQSNRSDLQTREYLARFGRRHRKYHFIHHILQQWDPQFFNQNNTSRLRCRRSYCSAIFVEEMGRECHCKYFSMLAIHSLKYLDEELISSGICHLRDWEWFGGFVLQSYLRVQLDFAHSRHSHGQQCSTFFVFKHQQPDQSRSLVGTISPVSLLRHRSPWLWRRWETHFRQVYLLGKGFLGITESAASYIEAGSHERHPL